MNRRLLVAIGVIVLTGGWFAWLTTAPSPRPSPQPGVGSSRLEGANSTVEPDTRVPNINAKHLPKGHRSLEEITALWEKYKANIPEDLHSAAGTLLMFEKYDPADPGFIEKCREQMAEWKSTTVQPVSVDKDRLARFLEEADAELVGPMKAFAAMNGLPSNGTPGREESYIDVARQLKEGKLSAEQITRLRQAAPDDALWKVYEARLAAKANDPASALNLANEIVQSGTFVDPALAMIRAAESYARTTAGISASEAYRRTTRAVPLAADSISELAGDLTAAAKLETDPDAQFRYRAAAAGLINLNTEHDDPGVRMNAALLEREMIESFSDAELVQIYGMPAEEVRQSQREQARAAGDMKRLRDSLYQSGDTAELAQYEAWRAEFGDYRALEMTASRRADPLSLGSTPGNQ